MKSHICKYTRELYTEIKAPKYRASSANIDGYCVQHVICFAFFPSPRYKESETNNASEVICEVFSSQQLASTVSDIHSSMIGCQLVNLAITCVLTKADNKIPTSSIITKRTCCLCCGEFTTYPSNTSWIKSNSLNVCGKSQILTKTPPNWCGVYTVCTYCTYYEQTFY